MYNGGIVGTRKSTVWFISGSLLSSPSARTSWDQLLKGLRPSQDQVPRKVWPSQDWKPSYPVWGLAFTSTSWLHSCILSMSRLCFPEGITFCQTFCIWKEKTMQALFGNRFSKTNAHDWGGKQSIQKKLLKIPPDTPFPHLLIKSSTLINQDV